jgi:nicotinate-nucleotide pyrophosphorylase (carboxylating)
LQEALKFPEVDYIMLDNMSRDTMREAVAITNNRCKLEASGNVNMHTVSRIAHTGVDFISIGAITHSVEALDISLMFR